MFRILFLLFSVLIIQGCGVRSPIARFKGAMVTQSTPEAIALTAQFEIANTNDEPLQLKFYNYTVTSGGRTVYRGMASAEQSVPRWSAMQSSIPIVIRREDMQGDGDTVWHLSGTLSYIPPKAMAETLLNIGIWEPSIQIRAEGVVDLPRTN